MLGGAAAAPPSRAATLVDHTYTMRVDANAPSDIVTTPALEKGRRYRLGISGVVRFASWQHWTGVRIPALDCDALFCVDAERPDALPDHGGIVAIARPGSRNFVDIDTYVGERHQVPYQSSHAYSETFRAREDGPIRIEGPSGSSPSYPAAGQVRLTLADAGEPELDLDYEVRPRFSPDARGRLPSYDTPREVAPDTFVVRLEVRRRGGGRCGEFQHHRFTLEGAKLAADRRESDACKFLVRLKEGRHKIGVRSRDRFGTVLDGEERIVVQDFLIFGIGDSAASGEGTGPNWTDQRCHRSRHSQQVLAAQAIEQRDDRSSVTFVHLACSGGRIDLGLLGGYAGIEEETPDLPPQVDEMRRLAGTREIDAVQMSIGVNQLAFGPLLGHCVATKGCQDEIFRDGLSADAFVNRAIASLPAQYAALAPRLDALLPAKSSDRVLITEYPELFRDEKGVRCDSVIAVPGTGRIDLAEILFLELRGAIPLHRAVGAAARTHGWTRVTGIRSAFHRHGYCAASDDRWIVTLTGSALGQFDKSGTMHPTREGYRRIASYVTRTLAPALFPKGRPRAPREPERGLGLRESEY